MKSIINLISRPLSFIAWILNRALNFVFCIFILVPFIVPWINSGMRFKALCAISNSSISGKEESRRWKFYTISLLRESSEYPEIRDMLDSVAQESGYSWDFKGRKYVSIK